MVPLLRTLSLISEVQSLASTNKALRSPWHERRATILRLVRDLLLVKLGQYLVLVPLARLTPPDPTQLSAPREACREKALFLMQDIPPGIIEKESFPKVRSLRTPGHRLIFCRCALFCTIRDKRCSGYHTHSSGRQAKGRQKQLFWKQGWMPQVVMSLAFRRNWSTSFTRLTSSKRQRLTS